MNLKQFLHEKLLKNDVFEKNLVKFGNHVETKPLEPVLWNFAWINGRLCAFRWYKAEFLNIDTLSVIKISFVTVVFDDRVVLQRAINEKREEGEGMVRWRDGER